MKKADVATVACAVALIVLSLTAIFITIYFGCVKPAAHRQRLAQYAAHLAQDPATIDANIPQMTWAATIAGTRIPKVIWTYWNSETPTPFLLRCVDTWRRFHPEYRIIILTPATLHEYTNVRPKDIAWNDSPARESDIVRAHVLATHGGVWSDMSIMLFGPCPQLAEPAPAGTEFMGFYLEGFTTNAAYPVIENWWFATAPGGAFMCRWRDVFMTLYNDLPVDDRIARIQADDGVDLQGIISGMRNYLFMHAAAQYVLQKEAGMQTNMVLSKAEDGPFKYLANNGWSAASAFAWLKTNPQPMIKMRSCERALAEKLF
jgi:hypothetical protein